MLTGKAAAASVIKRSPEYYFARHETFHPRHGWLKKGFDAIEKDAAAFAVADSHIRLGVGKNMGQAIRYWCLAFKIIEPFDDTGRSGQFQPTGFGSSLLSDAGWDPYLEDPASLWHLHWSLNKVPSFATAWGVVFNELRKNEFGVDAIQAELVRFRDGRNLGVSENSLQKDALCILRMYCEQVGTNHISEESLDCPFASLGLIQRTADPKLYQFRIGAKASLPPEIIVSASMEFMFLTSTNQRTISLAELSYGTGSPGRVFKLSEASIYDALEAYAKKSPEISFSSMAVGSQISTKEAPLLVARKALEKYYAGKSQ
ncbi:MAG: DUF4007 family protein [Pyrinomonadaceae bacterium]